MAKKPAPKKEKSKKEKVKKSTGPKGFYSVDNKKVVRHKIECPRCGPGYFMAMHYNRRTCGNCFFTQFIDRDGNVRKGGGQGPAPGQRERRSRRVRPPQ